MKYLCCFALITSALNGMEAPHFSSPPASPQTHSAPNSPGLRRYTREELLALGKSSLSRSTDSIAIAVDEIRITQSPQVKGVSVPVEVKTHIKYKIPHKRYGKK